VASVTVEHLVRTFGPQDWRRHVLRDSRRGPLQVDVACRRVWLWDGEESGARHWHLIVRREVKSPETIKYSLSNAPAETPHLRLAQMQGQRYWVERSFEDGKGECGLADYQALGWVSWHHHIAMVMLAMLMIAQARATHQPLLELLSARDVVRDPQRDLATQAGRQGCSVAPDQRTPPTPAQRHPVALSWPAKIRPLTGPTNVTLSN